VRGTVIWTRANVDDLRDVLYKAGVGTAVLVPVSSGTVIVPTEQTSMSIAAQWATHCRRFGGGVAVLWDDEAAIVLPVPGIAVARGWEWGEQGAVARMTARAGRYGPFSKAYQALTDFFTRGYRDSEAKQEAFARRLAGLLQAEEATVLHHVRRWNQTGPVEIFQLLLDAGKPDIVDVAMRVGKGEFDTWRNTGTSPIVRRRVMTAVLGVLVVAAGVTRGLVDMRTQTDLFLLLGVFLVAALVVHVPRRMVNRRPIDEVLPVVG
jgi:hypothetical protein